VKASTEIDSLLEFTHRSSHRTAGGVVTHSDRRRVDADGKPLVFVSTAPV